jgi:probable rRNA maturation factor
MVLNRQRRTRLAIRPLARFSERVRRELCFPEDSVTICFVSDTAIARMNRKFRNKRGSTDVLSFPARPKKIHRTGARVYGGYKRNTDGSDYVGDIVISPETAGRYARKHSRRLASELRVLILHGMLHLAGYDHEVDNGEMARLERRLRRRLGLR